MDGEYKQLDETGCTWFYGRFTSRHDAKEACFYDELCKGVVDKKCDGLQYFLLCYAGHEYTHPLKTCVHAKTGSFSIQAIIYTYTYIYIYKLYEYTKIAIILQP